MFKLAVPAWKRRVGWLAYVPAAGAALRIAPSTLRLIIDHHAIEARSPLVLVANGGSAIAPRFRIYPGIAFDDGWLDVLLFTPTTPATIVATLAHLGTQQLHRSHHVRRWRARHVRIEAEPPLAVELDGDIHGQTPRDFTILPQGLSVAAPLHPAGETGR
jgi:diacylglycerol kinase (ATP)